MGEDTKYGYGNWEGTNNQTRSIMAGHGYKVGTGIEKGQTTGSIRVGHGYKVRVQE